MKLYATSSNGKGKKEGVGDNEYLNITLQRGNKIEYLIYYTTEGLTVSKVGEGILLEQKGKSQKGELCKLCDGEFSNPHRCI